MRRNKINLDRISESELLKIKLSDLPLSIDNPLLLPLIKRVKRELLARKILMKPYFWLSDEWFCPNGTCGIAIPFYLAHPVLMKMEKKYTGELEGASTFYRMRLLRHEIGHAFDNIYKISSFKERRELFGKLSQPYPSSYIYLQYSKKFVKNLEDGYAQSHPAEDFAETFAICLDPNSNWKKSYAKWGAIKKLEYVNKLIDEMSGKKVKQGKPIEYFSLSKMSYTLEKYYNEKNNRNLKINSKWQTATLKMFNTSKKTTEGIDAKTFISKNKSEICEKLAAKTGLHKYTINKVLKELKHSAELLNLRATNPTDSVLTNMLIAQLSSDLSEHLREGRCRVFL